MFLWKLNAWCKICIFHFEHKVRSRQRSFFIKGGQCEDRTRPHTDNCPESYTALNLSWFSILKSVDFWFCQQTTSNIVHRGFHIMTYVHLACPFNKVCFRCQILVLYLRILGFRIVKVVHRLEMTDAKVVCEKSCQEIKINHIYGHVCGYALLCHELSECVSPRVREAHLSAFFMWMCNH